MALCTLQAIAAAVLHDLIHRARPMLLFSTHHHGLALDYGPPSTHPLGGDGPGSAVALRHMACEVDAARRRLTFLYRLRPGAAGLSHGLHCARAAGLPSAVVEEAEHRAAALEASSAVGGSGGEARKARRKEVLFATASAFADGSEAAELTTSRYLALTGLQREARTVLN